MGRDGEDGRRFLEGQRTIADTGHSGDHEWQQRLWKSKHRSQLQSLRLLGAVRMCRACIVAVGHAKDALQTEFVSTTGGVCDELQPSPDYRQRNNDDDDGDDR